MLTTPHRIAPLTHPISRLACAEGLQPPKQKSRGVDAGINHTIWVFSSGTSFLLPSSAKAHGAARLASPREPCSFSVRLPNLQPGLSRFSSGAVQQAIYFPGVKAFHICIPPIEEQRRIVAALDEAFAAIATATANVEKNLANARALLGDFLTLTFGSTANDWDVTTIGEACTLRSGTTVKLSLEQSSGELPYLKVADMSHPGNLGKVTHFIPIFAAE